MQSKPIRVTMKNKNYILMSIIILAVLTRAEAQTQFTKITSSPVVTDLGQIYEGIWGDFHNDGFLDLFAPNFGGRTNLFYLNNGDGTFTNITQGDPVIEAKHHGLAAAADYDNDGNLDLLVTPGVDTPTAAPNMLYHNNGDGAFSPVSGGDFTNEVGFFGPCSWADYDNDGFLDVIILNHGNSSGTGGANLVFHNNRDGTFSKVTSGALVHDVSVGWAALWADYDNDGFMDLFVVNQENNSRNFLYHNNRDGTFTKILTNVVATDSWSYGALGAAWGDYDNDGLPDLFVTDNAGVRNHLYHNNGNGSFTNVASAPMLQPAPGGSSVGCAWGDYDNDGYLDLFVTSWTGTNGLYHNNGDGTFTQVFSEPPVTDADSGPDIAEFGVSWVDYDNDGFLDLYLTRIAVDSAGDENPAFNELYHNNGNSNGWLEVKLIGTVANRSALGAKVRVHATIGGKTFWQLREINGGGGWNGVPLRAHFGLGNATNVDTVRIEWPSGTVQEFQNVAPRQILNITEPPKLLASTTNVAPQFFLKAWPHMQFDIQSSTNLANWSLLDTVVVSNLNGLAEIVVTNAPDSGQLFYRAVSR
jgi:hypothetical protein